MKTIHRFLYSSLLFQLSITILIFAPYCAEQLNAQTGNPLKDKLDGMVMKVRDIRNEFVIIASNLSDVNGADRFVNFVRDG